MESQELEGQIKNARKTKLMLYVLLAVLVAAIMFVVLT